MREIEIIIKAFKVEAESKPNERIFVGSKSYTYKEFANMLNNHKKLDKETRKLVDNFLKNALKLFEENEEFHRKIMALAGKDEVGSFSCT
ncbi:MAG: hypothetical protein QXZ68_06715 [Candidatus Bathyarchaeia archaeon]